MKKTKILNYVRLSDKKESLHAFTLNRFTESVITLLLVAALGYGLYNIFKYL